VSAKEQLPDGLNLKATMSQWMNHSLKFQLTKLIPKFLLQLLERYKKLLSGLIKLFQLEQNLRSSLTELQQRLRLPRLLLLLQRLRLPHLLSQRLLPLPQ
jgi:hypothetical protein